MSESRFNHYEASIAHHIAERLPRVDVRQSEDPFYEDVMKWCMKNYDLFENFSKIMTDDGAYFKCLEQCYERQDVEAFGLAIAMRLKWLQKG